MSSILLLISNKGRLSLGQETAEFMHIIIIYHHLHTSATSAGELSPSHFPNGLGMPWWSQHECHLRDHHSLSQGNQDL